jgi:hypothetical protein
MLNVQHSTSNAQVVILSGAKLQRSPESFWGEAQLSISDPRCFASLNMTEWSLNVECLPHRTVAEGMLSVEH